jgi:hypothetical protein
MEGLIVMQTWAEWQNEVVFLLQGELRESLRRISMDDIDWSSWLHFFIAGRSPRAAVDGALERDL